MSTLLDVVSGALTALGELGQGQTASPEDGALGQRLINLLLGKLGTQRLYLYTVDTQEWTLVPGTQDYTVGATGATFTGPRPTFVESAKVNVVGSNVWLPIDILDKVRWDALRNLGGTADIPDSVWPEYTFPNLTFHVNPAPIGAPKIRLGVWLAFTKFTSLFDPIEFPEGYEEFFESQLAIAMAPYYDKPVNQLMMQRAADAQASIMRINAQGMGGAVGETQAPNVGQPMPASPAPVQQ